MFNGITKNAPGIYGIWLIGSQPMQWYVGQTNNLRRRKRDHLRDYARKFGRLYTAVKALGPESFEFLILEECEPKTLTERERYWVERLGALGVYGFNCRVPGESPRGFTMSEAAKRRMSETHKGKRQSIEAIEKTAAFHRGSKRSPETCRRIGDSHKGRKHTAGARARMSASSPFKGKPRDPALVARTAAANKGRTHSEATRLKISKARTGCKLPEWARLKMRGRKPSPEARRKMSLARKGVPHSESHRLAIGKAHERPLRAIFTDGSSRTFGSAMLAAKELGLNNSNICKLAKFQKVSSQGIRFVPI